jgi:hypothetical protein
MRTFAIFAASMLLLSTACSKKSDMDDKDQEPLIDFFSYKINGDARLVTGIQTAYAFELSDTYGIYGWTVNDSGEGCYLIIPKGTMPGDYTIGVSPAVRGFFIDTTGQAFATSLGGTGTLMLESQDAAHVKGTFSFTAADGSVPPFNTVAITEGRFHVRFR